MSESGEACVRVCAWSGRTTGCQLLSRHLAEALAMCLDVAVVDDDEDEEEEVVVASVGVREGEEVGQVV